MNGVVAKTIPIDGNILHYHDIGVGEPVLLLHGWGSGLDAFSYLEKHLSVGFRVISLDLPGFGGSPAPSEAWCLNDYVELVKAFMDKVCISRPAIVGHSFGGRIAICLAAQGLVSKLILANSAGVRPKRGLLYYLRVYSYKLARHLLDLAPQYLRPVLLEKLQQRFGSSDYRSAAPILRKILVKVVNEDLTALLPKITAPTLLLWGDQDQATPLDQAKVMEKAIPDAGLVVLKGAGHYSFLDKPGEFNLIAEHFLRN